MLSVKEQVQLDQLEYARNKPYYNMEYNLYVLVLRAVYSPVSTVALRIRAGLKLEIRNGRYEEHV